MNEEQFDIICMKLDKLIALMSVQNIKDKDKKIYLLKKAGLTSKEIGELIGLAESSIRLSKGWRKK